jgi:hypothetical protein
MERSEVGYEWTNLGGILNQLAKDGGGDLLSSELLAEGGAHDLHVAVAVLVQIVRNLLGLGIDLRKPEADK